MSNDDLKAELKIRWDQMEAIADPDERGVARKALFDEMIDRSRQEARKEMATLEAAWSKFLDHWDSNLRLYMVLSDGERYSSLYGCKIVGYPSEATEQQVEEALEEEEQDNLVWYFDN